MDCKYFFGLPVCRAIITVASYVRDAG